MIEKANKLKMLLLEALITLFKRVSRSEGWQKCQPSFLLAAARCRRGQAAVSGSASGMSDAEATCTVWGISCAIGQVPAGRVRAERVNTVEGAESIGRWDLPKADRDARRFPLAFRGCKKMERVEGRE